MITKRVGGLEGVLERVERDNNDDDDKKLYNRVCPWILGSLIHRKKLKRLLRRSVPLTSTPWPYPPVFVHWMSVALHQRFEDNTSKFLCLCYRCHNTHPGCGTPRELGQFGLTRRDTPERHPTNHRVECLVDKLGGVGRDEGCDRVG